MLVLASCGKVDPNTQIDEGTISGNYYTSDEIGWTMQIPDGWEILTRKQVDYYENKGTQLIEDTIGEELPIKGLKNLLDFRKDQFNVFQSTSQPFELEYEGEWEESNEALKEVLQQTYSGQGIDAKSTETRREEIDGVVFEVFDFILLAPNGDVVVRQTMYSCLRNGFDFGVNLTYNSDEARDVMLKAWRGSKFKGSDANL